MSKQKVNLTEQQIMSFVEKVNDNPAELFVGNEKKTKGMLK